MRFLLLALYSACSLATPELVPIQEKAQGHSLTGSHLLNDSLYTNPAASAFTQVYSVEAAYWAPKSFAASILDTKTSEIGGGLGYFRKDDSVTSNIYQGAKLSLCGRVAPWVSVGVGGKILWGRHESGEKSNFKELDAGVLANLNFLQLGLAVRNIGGGNPNFHQEREWSMGGRINYEQVLFFSLSTQSRWNYFKPYQYGFGTEYVSMYYFSIKGGFRIQPEAGTSYWSMGVSLLAPKIGIHYALEIPNQSPRALEHIVGANLIL